MTRTLHLSLVALLASAGGCSAIFRDAPAAGSDDAGVDVEADAEVTTVSTFLFIPGDADFGLVNVGEESAPLDFRVVALSNGDVSPVPELSNDVFKVRRTNCDGRAMVVGQECNVELVFEPNEAVAEDGALTLGSASANLVGQGFNPSKSLLVDPQVLEFNDQQVGADPIAQRVSVTSQTGIELSVTPVLDSPDFSIAIEDCSGVTLQTGQRCDIDVIFQPTDVLPFNANLVILDDGMQPLASVSMSGNGVPSDYTLTINIEGVGSVGAKGGNVLCDNPVSGSSQCVIDFAAGTSTSLKPGAGQFQLWSGDCTGTNDCTVLMDQNRAITAHFLDN